MTRNERLILRYSRKIGTDKAISSEKLIKAGIPLDAKEILMCAKYMKDQGMFESYADNLNGEVFFRLNYSAIHYREFAALRIRDFLIRSILVPVLVSAVTTLIINELGKIL